MSLPLYEHRTAAATRIPASPRCIPAHAPAPCAGGRLSIRHAPKVRPESPVAPGNSVTWSYPQAA